MARSSHKNNINNERKEEDFIGKYGSDLDPDSSGEVLPYNVSLLNDLKTAYHHGDQAASEAVGNSKYLNAARKIGLSRGNKKTQNILYYQLIKK